MGLKTVIPNPNNPHQHPKALSKLNITRIRWSFIRSNSFFRILSHSADFCWIFIAHELTLNTKFLFCNFFFANIQRISDVINQWNRKLFKKLFLQSYSKPIDLKFWKRLSSEGHFQHLLNRLKQNWNKQLHPHNSRVW